MNAKLVLGLGAAGLLGFLLLRKKDEPQAPGTGPASSLPERPSGANLVLLGDPLSLKQGQYYRGRLQLAGTSLPPFSAMADEETLGKGLVTMGFADVRVYMGVKDLPADWPQSTMLNPVQGTRWFQGMWQGPSIQLPRPWNVETMWVTRSPNLVAAQAAAQARTSGMMG